MTFICVSFNWLLELYAICVFVCVFFYLRRKQDYLIFFFFTCHLKESVQGHTICCSVSFYKKCQKGGTVHHVSDDPFYPFIVLFFLLSLYKVLMRLAKENAFFLNEVIYMQILYIYSGRPTHLNNYCFAHFDKRNFNLDGFKLLLVMRKLGHDPKKTWWYFAFIYIHESKWVVLCRVAMMSFFTNDNFFCQRLLGLT